TFVAIALIDRVGRKPLLLAGSVGMTLTLGVMALALAGAGAGAGEGGPLTLGRGATVAALVAANLYILAVAVAWGPVVWVLLGEMFGNRFRGAGLAVAAAAQWLANFAVTFTFPALRGGLGLGGACGLYAAAALASFFFVAKWITETKG